MRAHKRFTEPYKSCWWVLSTKMSTKMKQARLVSARYARRRNQRARKILRRGRCARSSSSADSYPLCIYIVESNVVKCRVCGTSVTLPSDYMISFSNSSIPFNYPQLIVWEFYNLDNRLERIVYERSQE